MNLASEKLRRKMLECNKSQQIKWGSVLNWAYPSRFLRLVLRSHCASPFQINSLSQTAGSFLYACLRFLFMQIIYCCHLIQAHNKNKYLYWWRLFENILRIYESKSGPIVLGSMVHNMVKHSPFWPRNDNAGAILVHLYEWLVKFMSQNCKHDLYISISAGGEIKCRILAWKAQCVTFQNDPVEWNLCF